LVERVTPAPNILCVGGAVQDILMHVDKFPHAGSKVQASEFLITIGGQGGNAAVGAARLGAKVSYAGPLGDENDEIANWIVRTLEGEGIDCRHATRVAGAISSVSSIMIDAAGEKMIATRRGRKLTESVPIDASQVVAEVDAVLLDNRYPDFVIPIAKAAQARGIPRVLDFDWGDSDNEPLIRICTHVIASSEALRTATGINDLSAALQKLGAHYKGFLAVTNGPEGVYWLDRGLVRHMDAFNVKAVDTLGAGDVFHGAFTLRWVETGDVIESMRFASAAAAIKCTRFGGLMGAATRNEVDSFLARFAGS
jgi:sulfofructose kinase